MSSQPLSPARQRFLVGRAQGGDINARDLLVTSNRGLVAEIARDYATRGVEFEDLMQEGMLGLTRAVTKFDLKQPVRFSTYAAHWIRQGMGRLCEQQGSTNRYGYRLPAHIVNAMGRIARTRQELERRLGREATPAELAVACDLSLDAAEQAVRLAATPPAQSADQQDETGRTVIEGIADDAEDAVEELAGEDRLAALREMIQRLPEAERELVRHRYGLDGYEAVSERELAGAWDTDRAHLQVLRTQALRHLRRDPQLGALREGNASLPRQMREGVAKSVMRQCCGHLAPGADPHQIEMNETSRMSDRAIAGRVAGGWWLLAQPDGVDHWQIRLLDGQDGDLLTPSQAASRMRGEQLVEASQWVSRMPLAHSDECPACAAVAC